MKWKLLQLMFCESLVPPYILSIKIVLHDIIAMDKVEQIKIAKMKY